MHEGKLAYVEAWPPKVELETGGGIGATYEEVSAGLGELDCQGGMHEDTSRIMCKAKHDGELELGFEVGTTEFASKQLSASQAASALAGKKLAVVRWKP